MIFYCDQCQYSRLALAAASEPLVQLQPMRICNAAAKLEHLRGRVDALRHAEVGGWSPVVIPRASAGTLQGNSLVS